MFVALFPNEGGSEPDGASEEIVDLTAVEIAALRDGAKAAGTTVLMFMANAALVEARRNSGQDYAFRVRDNPQGVEALVRLQFTPEEYKQFLDAYEKFNENVIGEMGLAGFVKRNLEREAARVLAEGDPLGELEDAVNSAVAMIDFLASRCSDLADLVAVKRTDGLSDEVAVGALNLATAASVRLKRAYEAAHNYASGRSLQAGV